MTDLQEDPAAVAAGGQTLRELEDRVLWLSTAMVHHANRVRPNPSGVKVGGHQASSASLVSLMTSLWFRHLTADDRVSVKPHASPVLHALNYLLGNLEREQLTRLREFGGLQSYPSRAKDPDPVDYSTGSVGIGATATIWGALARRYVDRASAAARAGRQYALLGDAELDEGAIWEALLDPQVSELGELVWIVDLNRQSLDRVVPNIAAERLTGMFSALGWQVLTLKYGVLLEELFTRTGGQALRKRIDGMTNPEYQRLLRCDADELRNRLPGSGPDAASLGAMLVGVGDEDLVAALRNLGGHDLVAIDRVFSEIEDHRPTVIFAYTVKGYRLPIQGHPQNHSALLTQEQIDQLATSLGIEADDMWGRPAVGSAADRECRETKARLAREAPTSAHDEREVPHDLGHTPTGRSTTQAALGRALLDLSRQAPEVAARVVTVSPDVSSSTNLGGWINKVGVWSTQERTDWFADDGETILHWRERPSGQHVELGIAETNLVGLISELGSTWSRWGQAVYPIGVLYDPFIERALEPWSFGIYSGGQSILVGTPSGVTLAPEGGAHQSIKTPSIGLEQPACTSYEPAFAVDLEWVLLECLRNLGRPGGRSAYLRLSSRPVDQRLAAIPTDPSLRERRRRQVIKGGYRLRAEATPDVTVAAMGAVVPEALAAADRLAALGVACDVVVITSPSLVYDAMLGRWGGGAESRILDQLFPAHATTPLVTVLDGHPHALAFLAGIRGVPHTALGVTDFGQSGQLEDVYRHHGIDAEAVVFAALDLTGR